MIGAILLVLISLAILVGIERILLKSHKAWNPATFLLGTLICYAILVSLSFTAVKCFAAQEVTKVEIEAVALQWDFAESKWLLGYSAFTPDGKRVYSFYTLDQTRRMIVATTPCARTEIVEEKGRDFTGNANLEVYETHLTKWWRWLTPFDKREMYYIIHMPIGTLIRNK